MTTTRTLEQRLGLAPTPIQVDIYAKWLWEEAQLESEEVLVAVAWVLVRCGVPEGPVPEPPVLDAEYARAKAVIAGVLSRTVLDPTQGANIYYPVYCLPPVWERQGEFKIQIGNYRFYVLGDWE